MICLEKANLHLSLHCISVVARYSEPQVMFRSTLGYETQMFLMVPLRLNYLVVTLCDIVNSFDNQLRPMALNVIVARL